MFELAILHIIFNMVTLNINKMSMYNEKQNPSLLLHLKKIFNWAVLSGTAIFLGKSSNNDNKLKLTLQFPLDKDIFN